MFMSQRVMDGEEKRTLAGWRNDGQMGKKARQEFRVKIAEGWEGVR